MKFNRRLFIRETGGELEDALNLIESLTSMLNEYAFIDKLSIQDGYGCFSDPDQELKNIAKEEEIDIYFNF